MDRQCPSCGGFCKKSGCERENVKPKEWVGLTDEAILNTADFFGEFQYGDAQGHKRLGFARAIESMLKDKNT